MVTFWIRCIILFLLFWLYSTPGILRRGPMPNPGTGEPVTGVSNQTTHRLFAWCNQWGDSVWFNTLICLISVSIYMLGNLISNICLPSYVIKHKWKKYHGKTMASKLTFTQECVKRMSPHRSSMKTAGIEEKSKVKCPS